MFCGKEYSLFKSLVFSLLPEVGFAGALVDLKGKVVEGLLGSVLIGLLGSVLVGLMVGVLIGLGSVLVVLLEGVLREVLKGVMLSLIGLTSGVGGGVNPATGVDCALGTPKLEVEVVFGLLNADGVVLVVVLNFVVDDF